MSEMVLVGTASNQAEADIWQALLKGQGIPCVVRNTFGETSIERDPVLYSGLRVYVSARDYATARQILRTNDTTRSRVPAEAHTMVWVGAVVLFAFAVAGVVALLAVLA